MTAPTLSGIRAKLKTIKHISDQIEWKTKPTNSAYLNAVVDLYDSNNETIPGLSLICTFKKPIVTTAVSYKFFVHDRMLDKNYRIFGLEVYDKDYLSHSDKKNRVKIHGSHYHIGDKDYLGSAAIAKAVRFPIDNKEFERWFLRFSRHAKIKCALPPKQPFEIDLLGNIVSI